MRHDRMRVLIRSGRVACPIQAPIHELPWIIFNTLYPLTPTVFLAYSMSTKHRGSARDATQKRHGKKQIVPGER